MSSSREVLQQHIFLPLNSNMMCDALLRFCFEGKGAKEITGTWDWSTLYLRVISAVAGSLTSLRLKLLAIKASGIAMLRIGMTVTTRHMI